MPEIELILANDPITGCVNPPERVVIGQIMENVPIVFADGIQPKTFTQTVANVLWGPFNHNFNRELTSCRVIDTGDNEWEGIIIPIDNNNCRIDVGPYAYAGKVTIF